MSRDLGPRWVTRHTLLRCGVLFALIAVITCGYAVSQRTQAGENIARTAPYSLTPLPNYDLATGVWNTALTDSRRGTSWVGSDVIGWYWRSPIIYRQEFATNKSIDSVSIGTFTGSRSEVGPPANAFLYVKVPDGRWHYVGDVAARENAAEGANTLTLSFAPIQTNSVLIVIFRSTPYLMVDEVEVMASDTRGKVPSTDIVSDGIDDAVVKRRQFAIARAGVGPLGDDPANRFAWPLDKGQSNASDCNVAKISAWTESEPLKILAAKAVDEPTHHAVGGWLVGLLRIENNTDQTVEIKLEPSIGVGVGAPEVHIANYVLALDYRWRADVLKPKTFFSLPPHSMGLVDVRARVANPGPIQAAVNVTCHGVQQAVKFDGNAYAITPEDRPYGTTWSYLIGPARQLFRCGARINDDAWIDTAVVNSDALLPVSGRKPALFRTYLRVFKSSRRLLLFLNVTDPSWAQEKGQALDDQLKAWWTWVSKTIQEEGYSGQVMFYPADEVRGKDVDRLNDAAEALRRIAPSVPIYATIDVEATAHEAKVDVPQYLDILLKRRLPKPSDTFSPQIYATENYTKTRGLSDYYRRLSWLAFGEGWDGTGVWSMWDANGANKPHYGWLDFGGAERDFALIYSDDDGCPLPSRRLMAFQRGLEDFSLMRMCARRGAAIETRKQAQSTAQSDQWEDIRQSKVRSSPDFDKGLARLLETCGMGSE